MKLFLAFILLSLSSLTFAAGKITLTIDELHNIGRGDSLEACGKAIHVDGIKPLLVNVKHDLSSYTVVTDINGKWCVSFKRWLFNGFTTATASTMNFEDVSTENVSKRKYR